jgi:hypothetical protein
LSYCALQIADFTQEDLLDDDVFLLDTFTQVFVWVGNGSTEEEKAKSSELSQKYIAQANDGRDLDCPVVMVNSGSEPLMFTSQFVGWDPAFFERNKFADPYAARLAKLNEEKKRKELASFSEGSFLQTFSIATSPRPLFPLFILILFHFTWFHYIFH